MYDCEIATYPRVPAFADNTFTVTVEHIVDQYGLVIAPSATEKCGREYHALLAQRQPPYSTFNWGLESSIPTVANVTECDVAVNPDNCLSDERVDQLRQSFDTKQHEPTWYIASRNLVECWRHHRNDTILCMVYRDTHYVKS